MHVDLDLGDGRGTQRYRRETNTMPNWAGSCWYYLRYLDPANADALVDPENEEYWMGPRAEPVAGAPAGTRDPGGVDLYVGGVEHAVLHLLYARFWHKVLHDLGHLASDEPFRTYFSQGYIQAAAFRDDRGQPVEAKEVEEAADGSFSWNGEPVTREFGKIGKSLKNMISPDEMYASYGADTFRLYEMGLGPLEQSKPWDTRAVVGSQRFLQRLWRNVVSEETGEATVVDAPMDDATARVLHRTIDAVRTDYASLGFNTAIARLTELNNALTKLGGGVPREAAEQIVLMVAPLAPHVAEELWARLGHEESLVHHPFPVADPALLVEETVTCVVQVRGKVKDRLEVPRRHHRGRPARARPGQPEGPGGAGERGAHRHRAGAQARQRRPRLTARPAPSGFPETPPPETFPGRAGFPWGPRARRHRLGSWTADDATPDPLLDCSA